MSTAHPISAQGIKVGDDTPPPVALLLDVETPENVVLNYQLAGPSVRSIAYIIDFFVRMGILFVLSMILAMTVGWVSTGAMVGLLLVVVFALEWGYYVVCEVFFQGRTIGKRAMGLRVIQERGYPITFWSSALRNVLRAADSWPTAYGVGLISMMLSKKLQRVGDIVARTVVITDRAVVLPREPIILERIQPLPRTDIGSFVPGPRMLAKIEEFLGRRHCLTHERGHALASFIAALAFLAIGFPRLLREYVWYFVTASVLFFGSGAIAWVVVQNDPDLIHHVLSEGDLAGIRQSYGKQAGGNVVNSHDSQALMAGFYVQHNVGIALLCFGRGVLAGIGTVYTLLFNGIMLGAISGYVVAVGDSERFLSFVITHGSFELTAIAVAGAAGLILGHAILHPGSRTRFQALRERGVDAVKIAIGAGAMLIIAAMLEGFWSQSAAPVAAKYIVGTIMWIVVILNTSRNLCPDIKRVSVQRIPHNKLRWLWPTALVVLIAIHFWPFKIGAGIDHDSYSVRSEGKLALYYLLRADPESIGHTVTRNVEPLKAIIGDGRNRFRYSPSNQPKTLCILGPARYPNSAEWKQLLEWVSRGGHLVIAGRYGKPEFAIDELGIEVKRIRGRIDADSDKIDTVLVENGRLVWRSRGRIVTKGGAERLFHADGTVQAVRRFHGSGQVVVIASDFVFSNQSLAFADHSNAELAFRLLHNDFTRREFVVDESLNVSGTPKVVGLFLDPIFRPLTIQALIAVVLFGWWRSIRFGPLQLPAVTARHNIVDHTDAVGALHFKSSDGTTALRSYLRQFFAELKLKSHKGREDRVFEPIAVRMGKSVEAIRTLLQKATKAARNKNLDRRTAAAIIRKLSIVRRAARRKGALRVKRTRGGSSSGTNTGTPEGTIANYNQITFGMFLLGGALGGVVFGMLSDRIGRKRTMSLTIVMYSLFTCLSAFSQEWWHMAIFRFLVAMGVGGEWAIASAFVAEVFPQKARARVSGIFHASSILGTWLAIAAATFLIGNESLQAWADARGTPSAPWRIGFGIGVLPALLIIWIRRSLREPESWTEARSKASNTTAKQLGHIPDLFKGDLLRRTLVGVTLAAVGLATFWGAHVFGKNLMLRDAKQELLHEALKENGRPIDDAGKIDEAETKELLKPYEKPIKRWEMLGMFLVTTGGGLGLLSFGPLCERFGRRLTFLMFHIGGLIGSLVVFQLVQGIALLYVALPIFGFLTLGMHAGYAIYFPELFPTRLRGTGAGFCFNFGRIIAAPILFLSGHLREVELVDAPNRETILRNALNELQEEDPYDYVLFDCPPSLGVLTVNALTAVNEMFIPLQPHFFALQGLSKLLETSALVTRRLNRNLKVTGIILCLYESGTRLAADVTDDLRVFLESSDPDVPWANARIFDTRIRRNIKLAEAPGFGQSIFQYAANCPGAQDYRALAIEVQQAAAAAEIRVYLPYRSWSTLLKQDDPSVFLPLSKYRELLKQAEKGRAALPAGPTVSAVITEAHYTATVEKGFVRIQAALTVNALDDGWADVPLQFRGAAVGKMTSAGGKAILRGTGKGGYALMLPNKGTHKITLELTAKVSDRPEGREFTIGCPSVGISTLELTIPQAGQSVAVEPQLVALPVAGDANATRVKAGLGATSQISARWRPKVAATAEVKPLATVRNITRVRVQTDLILTDTQLEYDVLRGELKQLQFAVPSNHQILDVSGPVARVAGWTTKKDAKRQVVTVALSEPLKGRLALEVHTESPRSAEKGPVVESFSPAGIEEDGTSRGIHAVDVARENGFLILEHDESLSLTVDRKQGWTQVKADDLPKEQRRPNALYYRFYGTKSALGVSIHPVKPRITAQQTAQYIFSEKNILLTGEWNFDIARIGVFELKLKVPANFKIDHVVSAGMKSFQVEAADGGNVLVVAYDRKRLGQVGVTIAGHRDIKPEGLGKSGDLPLLEPLATERETGQIRLFAPTSLALIVDQSQSVGAFPARQAASNAPPGTRLVSAWDYQQRPVRLRIRTEPVPARVTARVGTAINVVPTTTRVQTRLEFVVEHSPVGIFRFLIPNSAVAGLRVRDTRGQAIPVRITEPKKPAKAKAPKAKPKVEPKKVAAAKTPDLSDWSIATIELPKPVIGSTVFLVEYEVAADGDAANPDDKAERAVVIQPLRVMVPASAIDASQAVSVAELHGEVSVSADPAFKVLSTPTGDDVETIDAREIEVVNKVDGEFFRYHQEPVSIALKATKLDIQPVVATVVSKALVEVLVGRDRTATYRCRYQVVSSERQRLRVDLPKTAEPLTVLIDGNKVNLERNTTVSEQDEFQSYLVNVARSQSSDRPFSILLQFVLPIEPRPFETYLGKLQLFLPKIGGGDDSSAVVQQLRTVIWLPREFALVGEADKFERRTWTRLTGILPNQFVAETTPDKHEKWIGIDPGGFDFPTEGHSYRYDNLGGTDQIELNYAQLSFATWTLSIPLLLIGWVLARTSWENKLGVLLLIVFAATLLHSANRIPTRKPPHDALSVVEAGLQQRQPTRSRTIFDSPAAKGSASMFRTTALLPRVLIVAAFAHATLSNVSIAEDAKSDSRQSAREIRTYVPLEAFDLILKNSANGVVMTREEFRRLSEQAARVAAESKSAPRGIVIRSASYRASLSDDQLLMTADITFRRFAPGWRALRLPFGSMRAEEATLNGQPATIGRDATDGALMFFDESTSEGTLNLKLSTPVHRIGADKVAIVDLVGSPVATFQFRAPAGQSLSVDGAELKRPADDGAVAEYSLGVGSRKKLRIRISDGKQSRPANPLLLATTRAVLNVKSSGADWSANSVIEAIGKPLSQLEFTVPGKLKLTEVVADGMAAWQLKAGDDDDSPSTVLLTFRRPVIGQHVVRLRGILDVPANDFWLAPALILKGADSHVGQLAISHSSGVRLRIDEYDGVRLMDESKRKVPKPTTDTRTMTFQVWRENFELTLNTSPYRARVKAETAATIDIDNEGARLSFLAVLVSRRRSLEELLLTLPAEWPVTTVTIDGKPVRWTAPPVEANIQHLHIEVPEPGKRPGSPQRIRLEVRARRALEFPDDEKGTADFRIPELRLPQVESVRGSIIFTADDAFDITLDKVTGMRSIANRFPRQQFGYSYQATSKQETWYAGDVKVGRKPPRIATRTLAYTRLDPSALRTYFELEFDVTGSGIPKLVVSLPEAVSDRLRFRIIGGPGRITEQTAAPAADGRRNWTLTFNRRISGIGTIAVAIETDRKWASKKESGFVVHTLNVPAAERQSGFIVVEAGDDQRLKITTRDDVPAGDAANQTGVPLTEIDPVELPVFRREQGIPRYTPRQRVVAAYRYIVPGYRVVLAEEQLTGPSVPAAVCNEHSIESVLSGTGEFQHRATYRLKTGGVQGLRFHLPDDAPPWATLLNGRPVEVRKEGDAFFVSLSRVAHSSVRLEIFYRTRVELPRGVGRVGQRSPRLTVIRGTGQESPLEILDRVWTLYTPPELLVVDSDGLFRPATQHEGSSLLAHIRREFSMDSPKALGQRMLFAAILGALVVLTVVSIRRYGANGAAAVASILVIIGMAVMIPLLLSTSSNTKHGDIQSAAPVAMSSKTGSKPTREFFPGDFSKGEHEAPEEGASIRPAPRFAPGMKQPVPAADRLASEPLPRAGDDNKKGGKQDAPANATRSTETGKDGGRRTVVPTARLSVALQFQPPASHEETVFRYYGSAVDTKGETTADQLVLVTESYNAGVMLRISVATGIVLLFWLIRRRSLRFRAMLAAIAVALPPALVTFTPVLWHVFLDGLFCGGLIGSTLWGIRAAVVHWAHREQSADSTRWNRTSAVTSSILIFAFGIVAADQQVTCAQPEAGKSVRGMTATPRSGRPVVPTQDSRGKLPIRANSIVIPYDDTTDPLNADRVLVPYQKFVRLWKRANPRKIAAKPGPVDGLVAQAMHVGVVKPGVQPGRKMLFVKSRIVLYSFRDRRILLPVPIGHVAFQSARLDGRPASLVTQRSGKSAVVRQLVAIPSAGMHVLDVTFQLPIDRFGAGGRVTIPLRKVATGRLTLQLPKPGLSVQVEGQTGAYRRRKTNNQESLELGIDRGGDLRIQWTPPGERVADNNILHADLSTSLHIDDSGVSQRTEALITVRRGRLASTEFVIPNSFKLKQISGADVAGLQAEQKPEGTSVRVFLRRTVSTSSKISIQLFRPLTFSTEETNIEAAAVQVGGVARRVETIRITADPQFIVRTVDLQGFTQVDSKAAVRTSKPKNDSSAFELSLRTSRRDARLKLDVKRREMQTDVTAEHRVRVGRRDVEMSTRFTFDMKGTPRSKVVLLLPEKLTINSIQSDKPSEWSAGDDATIVFIQFATPQAGLVNVELNGTLLRDPTSDSVPISFAAPSMATTMNSSVAVRLNAGIDATITGAQGWTEIRAGRLPKKLQGGDSRPIRFGLQSKDAEPGAITLKVTRTQPTVSADAVTVIRVTDIAVHQTVIVKWNGLVSADDPLAFTTPSWLAEKLDFHVSRGVRVRRAGGPALPNGRVRWIVQTDSIPGGSVAIVGTAALPPPRSAENRIRAPVLDLEAYKVEDDGAAFASLARQTHVAVLANHASGKIEAEKLKSLIRVAETQLPKSILFGKEMRELIAQAVARVRIPHNRTEPVWVLRTFVSRTGAAAVVNSADLLMVIERDGTWRCRADYSIKNQTRQFLALVLPGESRVLSVVVRNRASRTVEIKRNDTVYALIPLPKTGDADLALDVRVILAGTLNSGPLPSGVRLSAAQIDLPAPRVVTRKEDAQFGIPVARTKWTVHVPPDFDVSADTNADVTNVTEVTDGEQSEFEELAVLREYNRLYQVLSQSDSGRKKKQVALGNLQQLEAQLERLDRQTQLKNLRPGSRVGFDAGTSNRQLESERSKFQSNFIELRSKYGTSSGKKTIDLSDESRSLQLLNPQEQQAAVKKQASDLFLGNNAPMFNKKKRSSGGQQQGQISGDTKAGRAGMPGYTAPPAQNRPGSLLKGNQGLPDKLRDLAEQDEKPPKLNRDRQVDFDVEAKTPERPAATVSVVKEGTMSIDFQFDAFSLVLGNAPQAFDLKKEDPKTVQKYGSGLGQQMLVARRLCEAGCGGLKMGQVVGDSDAKAYRPATPPIRPQDLMATVFDVLGIDRKLQYVNQAGRPVYLIEEVLKQWEIEPTTEGINQYLRKLHPDSKSQQKAQLLVKQLGDRKYAVRERATRQLLHTPLLPIDALSKASKGPDAEVRWRARKILKSRGTESSALIYNVFQAVEYGKIPGTVDDLLRTIPQCEHHYLNLAARRAIVAAARIDDIPGLRTALKNPDPEVQSAAIVALVKLTPKSFETELIPFLRDKGIPDSVALVTAQAFANVGNRDSLPVLLRLMSSSSNRIRGDAVATLRVLTGQHYGFAAYDPVEKRNACIKQWSNWLSANAATAKLQIPLPPLDWGGGSLGGNLLLAFGYQNKVVEYDAAGKEIWSYPVKGAWSAEKLPNGNVLIAGYYEKKVIEVTPKKKVVWSFDIDRCLNARLLQNGNILIAVASGRKVLEVTRDKQIVWQYATTGNCRDVHRLQNGNTLIASGNLVEEVTPDKKQKVWSFHASQPYGLQPLRNGNILIADWNGRVIEVTRSKKIVWEHKISRPGDAFRLPNGNTLITNDKKFVEVTLAVPETLSRRFHQLVAFLKPFSKRQNLGPQRRRFRILRLNRFDFVEQRQDVGVMFPDAFFFRLLLPRFDFFPEFAKTAKTGLRVVQQFNDLRGANLLGHPFQQTNGFLVVPGLHADPDVVEHRFEPKLNTRILLQLTAFVVAIFFRYLRDRPHREIELAGVELSLGGIETLLGMSRAAGLVVQNLRFVAAQSGGNLFQNIDRVDELSVRHRRLRVLINASGLFVQRVGTRRGAQIRRHW
eukprot:g8297.t1